jgi:hypothetical protein
MLEEELRRVWRKPIEKTPVSKDLPRLAGRIIIESPIPSIPVKHLSRRVSTLRLSQITEISEHIEATDKLQVVGEGSSTVPPVSKVWRQIQKAIMGVAVNLEPVDKVEEIREGLDKYASYQGELELAMNDLFENVIGPDSKTARVFKTIHQNILFVGCYELKTKITMNTMTKDVRGPEGWRILISFTKDTCSITHYKREESLATAPPTERFWFEWKIHMIFDKDMTDMQAAFLKVTNLGFGDEISDTKKAEITKMLCAGNLIIS